MKVKHIISTLSTCGVILGGIALAEGASATITYVGSSDVQFTFASKMSVTVSDDFTIADLAPSASKKSDAVTVTVDTNSSAGYTLSATVGDTTSTTYNTSALVKDSSNTIAMIDSSATSLSSGKWGYTLDDGTTYGALSTTTAKVLNKTSDKAGTAASSEYGGTNVTSMKIGATAATDQRSGEYKNVINFTAVSNVVTYNVAVTGEGTSAVTPATTSSYETGDKVDISATCDTGKTFGGWTVVEGTYGTIADPTAASTTYTVGAANVTLKATCY